MTIEAIRRGALEYIEREIQPHLSAGQSAMIGAYALLVARNVPAIVEKYKTHPLVALTGVVSANGDVDVDTVADVVRTKFFPTGSESYTVDVPMLPRIKMNVSDLDKLVKYIEDQA